MRLLLACVVSLLLFAASGGLAVSVDRFLASANTDAEAHGAAVREELLLTAGRDRHGDGWCESSYAAPNKEVRFNPRGLVNEESGIATSRMNDGVVWVHNDNFSPKHVYGILARSENAEEYHHGSIVAVLDLEQLPHIGHNSDFEDISVARCPFQANVTDAAPEWCLWIADTGANFFEGTKEIFMYVVKEPQLQRSYKGSYMGMLEQVVSPDDLTLMKIKYDPGSYYKEVPNVEAMTTRQDGSKFWLIEKTFSKGGDGPAGIWESPDFSSQDSLAATNVIRYNDVCVRSVLSTRLQARGQQEEGEEFAWESDDGLVVSKGKWKCRPETAVDVHPALTIRSVIGDDDNGNIGDGNIDDGAKANATTATTKTVEQVTVYNVFLAKVNEIENPYPDCTREDSGEDEHFSIYEYPASLPVCQGEEKEPEGHSCRKQRNWGKCDEDWMLEKGFCDLTCRRCRPAPREEKLEVRSNETGPSAPEEAAWVRLEASCNGTKSDHRNVRNIAAADLHESGARLLLATYGGIFEYSLSPPFDFSSLTFERQVSTTNRDGSESHDSRDYWKGQEGVAYDYTGYPALQRGRGIWSVSEHHQGLYFLGCKDRPSRDGNNNPLE